MENEVQIQSLVKKLLKIYNACKWSTSKLYLRKKKYLPKTTGELGLKTSELDSETETKCHQRNIFVFTQTLPTCSRLNTYLTDPRKTKSSYSLLKEDYTSQSSTDFRTESTYEWVCRCEPNTSRNAYGKYHSVNVCTCPSCCCKKKKKYGSLDKQSNTEISGVKNTSIIKTRKSIDKADEIIITDVDDTKEIQVSPRNIDNSSGTMNKKFEKSQISHTGLLGCECKCEYNRRSIACQSSPAQCRECSTLTLLGPPTPGNTSPIKSNPGSNSSNTSCSCQCDAPIDDSIGDCQCCLTDGPTASCRKNCRLTPDKKCCCNKHEQDHNITKDIHGEKIITPTKYSNEDAVPSQNVSLILSDDLINEISQESYRGPISSNSDRFRNHNSNESRQKNSSRNRLEEDTITKRHVETIQSSPPRRRSQQVDAISPYMTEIPKDFFKNMKSCECSCPRCRKKDTINATQTHFENRIKDYYADISHCLSNIPTDFQNHYTLLRRPSEIGTIDEGVNTYNNVIVQTYTSSTVQQDLTSPLQIGPCQQRNQCCTCGKLLPSEKEIVSDYPVQSAHENFGQPSGENQPTLEDSQKLMSMNSLTSPSKQSPLQYSAHSPDATPMPSGYSPQSPMSVHSQPLSSNQIRSENVTSITSAKPPQSSSQFPDATAMPSGHSAQSPMNLQSQPLSSNQIRSENVTSIMSAKPPPQSSSQFPDATAMPSGYSAQSPVSVHSQPLSSNHIRSGNVTSFMSAKPPPQSSIQFHDATATPSGYSGQSPMSVHSQPLSSNQIRSENATSFMSAQPPPQSSSQFPDATAMPSEYAAQSPMSMHSQPLSSNQIHSGNVTSVMSAQHPPQPSSQFPIVTPMPYGSSAQSPMSMHSQPLSSNQIRSGMVTSVMSAQHPPQPSSQFPIVTPMPYGSSAQSPMSMHSQPLSSNQIRSGMVTSVMSAKPPPQLSSQFPLVETATDPGTISAVNCCCCYRDEVPRGKSQIDVDDIFDDVDDAVFDEVGDGDQFPGLTEETKGEIRDALRKLEDTLLKESRLHKKNMTGILRQLSKQAGEIKQLKVHVKGVVETKRAVTCEQVEKKIRKMEKTKQREEKKMKQETKEEKKFKQETNREEKSPKQKKETAKSKSRHDSSTCCKCDKKKKEQEYKIIGCCGQCCANRCCGCCGTCCGGCCVDLCDCCCSPCEQMCPCCSACASCCDTCCSCGCFSSRKKCKCR